MLRLSNFLCIAVKFIIRSSFYGECMLHDYDEVFCCLLLPHNAVVLGNVHVCNFEGALFLNDPFWCLQKMTFFPNRFGVHLLVVSSRILCFSILFLLLFFDWVINLKFNDVQLNVDQGKCGLLTRHDPFLVEHNSICQTHKKVIRH